MQLEETSNNSNHYGADNLLRLGVNDLLIGMFVFELDCPWSKTPFAMGGFHLKNVEDIQILTKHCKHVVIDTNKGVQPRKERQNQLTILSSARRAAPESNALKIDRDAYAVSKTIKQQIDKAHRLHLKLKTSFAEQAIAVRNGAELDLPILEKQIDAAIASVVANPQTHIWLLNTDPSDRAATDYCVRAMIWALVLARQVGMPVRELKILGLGTVLADIGMQLLPERLTNKRGPFRKKEFVAYRKHVEFGVELLSHYPDLDPRVSSVVQCHHERQDGLGFPNKLRGRKIPSLARFANLAYSFERLLQSNNDGPARPPAKALTKLYKQRGLKFPQQLVVELIHVMGTYPIGSLVTLSSGEVGLVLEQNPQEKLSPRIAVLTDTGRAVRRKPIVVDLANQGKSKLDRAIVSSYKSQNSARCLGEGGDLDPRNYSLSFFGMRIGVGIFSFRL
ncbi:MAG: metal-dependent phosphohydrolase [Pseudohongiella sp.]|nr:MAG: metal-dependent phosphohydrolase [Pseudohongiella sp.]